MRTIRIGLLGLGNVGSAVADALRRNGNHFAVRTGAVPVVTRVAVKHLHKPRRVTVDPDLLTDDARRVVRDPGIDVIVEAIGGVEPAGSYLTEALARGKHVVTANKQLHDEENGVLLRRGLRRCRTPTSYPSSRHRIVP